MSRAQVFIPILQQYGTVDVLISSRDHDLALPITPTYQLNGLGFTFGKSGGIDYWKSLRRFKLIRFLYDLVRFRIRDYDVIINDFEPLTAWKCKLLGKRIIGLSHHASYLSKLAPRPAKKDWFTELVLTYHSPCSVNYCFHFERYDSNIYTPILRPEIREGRTQKLKHIVVYLPSIAAENLVPYFELHPQFTFKIFCKHSKKYYREKNVEVHQIDTASYINALLSSCGVICNAGFEAASEAIHLGKKLLCITMKGQYEQRCNAEALKRMGVTVADEFNTTFAQTLQEWLIHGKEIQITYPDISKDIIRKIMDEEI